MKKTTLLYRIIKGLVALFYPKMELVGNLPEGAAIIVGNHTKMNGPICSELFIPKPRYTWCVGEMMNKKEVAAYAYRDFWSEKPKWICWFYKLLSHVIGPLAEHVFTNADTIAVYHDARIMTTFKTTLKRLQEGSRIVIFPEHDVKYNHILYDFQDRFVDLARLYYKKTGQALSFVPLYIAPALKKMIYGKPIRFQPEAPIQTERERICTCLKEEITRMACALPRHRVTPYRNIPKKDYPYNIPEEVHQP